MTQRYAMKESGRRLAKLFESRRIELGMSRQDVATKMGVTHQQICKYEKCQNRMSIDVALDMSDILQLNLEEVFRSLRGGRVGVKPIRQNIEFVRAFERIKSRKARNAILDLMRSFGKPVQEAS